MPVISNNWTPTAGMRVEKLIRNGAISNGFAAAELAYFHNAVAFRRLRVLSSMSSALTRPIGDTATGMYGRFKTSSGCKGVVVRVAFGPNDGASATPYVQFTVGGVAQERLYSPSDNSGTKSIDSFDELKWNEQEFLDGSGDALAPNTAYNWSMSISGSECIAFQITIFEIAADTLDTASDALAVDPSQFAIGAPVLDSQINSIAESAWTLHKRGGPPFVHWSWSTVDLSFGGSGTEPSVTGTSWVRVIDGGSSTFATSALGHQYWPYRQNRAVTTTIPCTFWAVLKTSATGTAECRFENSAGVAATVTSTSTSYAYATTTGTVSGSATRDLFVVSHRNASVGQTTNVVAYGVYPDDV